MSDFIVCINIICEFDQMKKMFDQICFPYFNLKKEIVKYYNDELTYFVFETNLSRQELYKIINDDSNIMLKKNIIEIQFCNKSIIN